MASSDLQLSELVSKVQEITGITVHVSTICRLLAEHGFTRKKVQHVALQRRMDLRAAYMISEEWVDESGSDSKDQLRKYGYALRGHLQKATCTWKAHICGCCSLL